MSSIKKTANQSIKNSFKYLLNHISLDEITVNMICQRAEVNRQTFYYHYYDIVDLFVCIYFNELKIAIRKCDTYHNWVAGFKTILNYLVENKSAVVNAYHSKYRSELKKKVREYGHDLLDRAVRQCSADINVKLEADDEDGMVRFYLYVFTGIIYDFIESDMKTSPDDIVYKCSVIMDGSITRAIRLFAGGRR